MFRRGTLTVITGTMFSGKTDELIHRLRRLREYGRKEVIVFKPVTDTRSPKNTIASKDATEMPAIEIPSNAPDAMMAHVLHRKIDVIGIDEIQFFPINSGLSTIVDHLLSIGCDVVAAGLDLNFRGEPFGSTPALLALADETEKLLAYCKRCGDPARLPQRLINGAPADYHSPLILVGGAESYEARCYQCFELPGKPAPFKISVTPPAL